MIKKISELISELENFKKEYGDLPVSCTDNECGDYTPYIHFETNDYWEDIPKGEHFCNLSWIINP